MFHTATGKTFGELGRSKTKAGAKRKAEAFADIPFDWTGADAGERARTWRHPETGLGIGNALVDAAGPSDTVLQYEKMVAAAAERRRQGESGPTLDWATPGRYARSRFDTDAGPSHGLTLTQTRKRAESVVKAAADYFGVAAPSVHLHTTADDFERSTGRHLPPAGRALSKPGHVHLAPRAVQDISDPDYPEVFTLAHETAHQLDSDLGTPEATPAIARATEGAMDTLAAAFLAERVDPAGATWTNLRPRGASHADGLIDTTMQYGDYAASVIGVLREDGMSAPQIRDHLKDVLQRNDRDELRRLGARATAWNDENAATLSDQERADLGWFIDSLAGRDPAQHDLGAADAEAERRKDGGRSTDSDVVDRKWYREGTLASAPELEAVLPGATVKFTESKTDTNHKLNVTVPNPDVHPEARYGHNIQVGSMSWNAKTGRVEGVLTEGDFQRRGVASAMWDLANRVTAERGLKAPEHSETQTPEGAAWAASLAAKGRPEATGTEADPIDVQGDLDRAVDLIAEGKHVRLNQPDEVSTLVGKIRDAITSAQNDGRPIPDFNLCQITVANTNLFCHGNQGIGRLEMPQLAGRPVPGSEADKLPKNPKGAVDMSAQFADALTAAGINVEDATVPATHLRATQNELNGQIVARMAQELAAGTRQARPIFVTRDNYVIDGHHNWAAQVVNDTADNLLGNEGGIPVRRIDLDIGAALDFAREFTKRAGLQGADAKTDPGRMVNLPLAPTRSAIEAGTHVSLKRQANSKVFVQKVEQHPAFGHRAYVQNAVQEGTAKGTWMPVRDLVPLGEGTGGEVRGKVIRNPKPGSRPY